MARTFNSRRISFAASWMVRLCSVVGSKVADIIVHENELRIKFENDRVLVASAELQGDDTAALNVSLQPTAEKRTYLRRRLEVLKHRYLTPLGWKCSDKVAQEVLNIYAELELDRE